MKNILSKKSFFLLVFALGWILLLFNLTTIPFKFDFKWSLMYAAIGAFVVITWLCAVYFYLKFIKKRDFGWLINTSRKAGVNLGIPWFLFTPAEDGLFLVPLLYVGDNYVTAGLSAFLFGWSHSITYPKWSLIPKGITFFIAALFILPMSGVAPLVVGHWLVDVIADRPSPGFSPG